MQAAARTPNSILRKRLNKENEDAAVKAAKRNKLANRRVSFAPDDELETKHIFGREDSRDERANTTAELAIVSPGVVGLPPGAGGSDPLAGPHASAYGGQLPPPDHMGTLPSPGGLSPLSMDLTNNSYDQGAMAAMAQAGGGQGLALEGALLPSQQQHPHQHHRHHADYTRNITMNVPNLSTLVEEDEEEYAGGEAVSADTGAGAGAGAGGGGVPESPASMAHHLGGRPGAGMSAPSPISPFVLREMQRAGSSGDDEVRNRWGFTPGADDTMEVSFGRAVMGETTYNHVYGGATTGDLTKAIKDGQTGGPHYGQPGGVTRALVANAANRASMAAGAGAADGAAAVAAAAAVALPDEAGPSHPQPQLPPTAPVPQPRGAVHFQPHSTPFLDNTTKLLEDDQTDAWRLPGQGAAAYDRGRLSVASNKVLPPGGRRGGAGAAAAAAAGVGGGGETTMLLGPTTQLLAPGGMAGAGGGGGGVTATMGGGHTAQLLADTTTHKTAYERFLRSMPGRPQPPPSAAQPPRPPARAGSGEAPAASSSAAELRRLAAAHAPAANPGPAAELTSHSNMSLDLLSGMQGAGAGLGAGGGFGGFGLGSQGQGMGQGDGLNVTSTDLLAEGGGLSLDAFALPPEPTVNLSQQMQAGGRWPSQTQRQGSGVQAAVPPPPRPAAPKISSQEFLSLIDVSFNDRVCRTSYLPQSDPPPRTTAEVYDWIAVTGPYVASYQAMMLEVSGRLMSMQANVGQLEAELSSTNPELFAAVQLAPPLQLESIKEQCIGLKKLCRIRTVKAIKQTHLAALDDLLAQLTASKAAMQAELQATTADVERLNRCAEDRTALTAAIARRCQEDEAQLQDAAQRKRTLESLQQRLEALRAQNAAREKALEAAREEQRAVEANQVPKETLLQERSMLEARASALSARMGSSSALTPGREGAMARQVATAKEELDALLGLQALRIDASRMESSGRFSLTYRGTYTLDCACAGEAVQLSVRVADGAAARLSGLAPNVVEQLGASAAALSCDVPRAQLPLRLECVLRQLHRMARLASQLESCWLQHGCMQKPTVVFLDDGGADAGAEAGTSGTGAAGAAVVPYAGRTARVPYLELQFLNADTVARVSIRMPWAAALAADALAPPMAVSMASLEQEETQAATCAALQEHVLGRLAPSPGFLPALCFAMSATLQVSNGSGAGGSATSGSGADGAEQEASVSGGEGGVTPLPAGATAAAEGAAGPGGRVFDNPLFTFAAI
ncbi:hypothetical protein HYH03_001643 [Edaphochlamys debaryana]|uniref:Spc7 kinetochore protein domain-containing protein n=1 Tax=Edaphochlamys debaryana TaxID=47281 RepID=A0A835YDU5_9CHLO|nr:hypothetical protein HYH03_001643 [Edaphochlamys debaryana]|eukprot:KAG2500883.1 hypothetical protein HYH03_001643 [Edaphochlamys debaryana]